MIARGNYLVKSLSGALMTKSFFHRIYDTVFFACRAYTTVYPIKEVHLYLVEVEQQLPLFTRKGPYLVINGAITLKICRL